MLDKILYPAIEPYKHDFLPVSDGHNIYWEECGNPDGLPVIFLHGGPGAGCSPHDRRFFDPAFYRIILIDQRGCGRSQPHLSLESNTTWHLINDIEVLRNYLQIKKWVVFGGSWGSTLALVYAESYPASCYELVLRGIFLGREKDIQWYLNGTREIYPDYWFRFQNFLPKEEQGDLLGSYYNRVTNSDEEISVPAAKSFCLFEFSCANLIPNQSIMRALENKDFSLSFARAECHYFYNKCFLDENYILENISKISHIPIVIVHGRYDILCPLSQAHLLAESHGNTKLNIIEGAGHSFSEFSIAEALINEMNAKRDIYNTSAA